MLYRYRKFHMSRQVLQGHFYGSLETVYFCRNLPCMFLQARCRYIMIMSIPILGVVNFAIPFSAINSEIGSARKFNMIP